MSSSTWLDRPDLWEVLRTGALEVEGRLAAASNATLRCLVSTDDGPLRCVVKPVAGERALWDFPESTLTRRELAAHALSELLGWGIVPPTVWREDGPGGAGMCQLWIDEDPETAAVGVTRPDDVPGGWLTVLEAEDQEGQPVVLVHDAGRDLLRMAVFDVIANNADRKGGHVLTDHAGRIWGIDHGVTFAVEPKLRTVLWGWMGDTLPDDVLADVDALHARLQSHVDPLDRWLADEERESLRARVHALVQDPVMPAPSGGWPAIPWPVF
jgi:uncharacterized repeat protein (TIGR03843 family)